MRGGVQTGIAAEGIKADLGVAVHGAHLRQEFALRVAFQLLRHLLRVILRQRANFKVKCAFGRHNIQRPPALNQAGLHCGERRIKTRILAFRRGEHLADSRQAVDQLRGILDGVNALRRVGGMAGRALHFAAHGKLAFVTEHRLQFGRLAYQAEIGLFRATGQHIQQSTHAKTAYLFVIRNRQMQRLCERLRKKMRHCRQHAGDKAFHVRCAAAVQLAVSL
ncbi:Uncharacterised protein [Klebsiella pneumoniae]|nr:Uncharacterised protein [Klebsiella pneumoniae]